MDRTVNNLWKTGQMDALYKKWFLSPIPPKNTNLNMQQSSSYKNSKLTQQMQESNWIFYPKFTLCRCKNSFAQVVYFLKILI